MTQSDGLKYEAPRAVRLGDVPIGELMCSVGTDGNANVCSPNGTFVGHNLCYTGQTGQAACATGSTP